MDVFKSFLMIGKSVDLFLNSIRCGANPSTSDSSSEASSAVSSSAVSSEPEVKKDPVTLEWLAYNCYGQPQEDA